MFKPQRPAPRIVSLSLATLALFALTASATIAQAEVKPNGLFTDNMVLQCDMPLPVWGTAADGDTVTVSFAGQTQTATAKDGKWKVTLPPQQANAEPQSLTIAAGDQKIELKNVLVGEVWLCSGQSNMQWSISASADPKETIANSENKLIRLFTVPRGPKPEPQTDVEGQWHECGPNTVGGFSAVAYHFGQALQEQLKVPVGLISTNVGGTAAQRWASKETLAANPALATYAAQKNSSDLYNAMIHPLVPFAVRGAIWYQGESNAGGAYSYRTLFPAMIGNWREMWQQPNMPFLFVQLAPFKAKVEEPLESDWAELREAQLLTALKDPNAAMAVITDVGDEKDIHPKQKKPVGERLAIAARKIAYGENMVHSGPIFESLTVSGDKALLRFKHVGKGLECRGEKLTGFTIAGEDKKFVNAEAKIDGDTVVVSAAGVEKPVAVRFGWANFPVVNLWNKDGLPASPFRTDDWPGVTQPKEEAAAAAPGAK